MLSLPANHDHYTKQETNAFAWFETECISVSDISYHWKSELIYETWHVRCIPVNKFTQDLNLNFENNFVPGQPISNWGDLKTSIPRFFEAMFWN